MHVLLSILDLYSVPLYLGAHGDEQPRHGGVGELGVHHSDSWGVGIENISNKTRNILTIRILDDNSGVLPVHVQVEAVVAGVVDPDVLQLHGVHVDGLQDDLQLGHHRGQFSHPLGRDEGYVGRVSLLQIKRKF